MRHAYFSLSGPDSGEGHRDTPADEGVVVRRRGGGKEEVVGSRVEEVHQPPADPLRWFGVLTPPALKQAKVRTQQSSWVIFC